MFPAQCSSGCKGLSTGALHVAEADTLCTCGARAEQDASRVDLLSLDDRFSGDGKTLGVPLLNKKISWGCVKDFVRFLGGDKLEV